MDPGFHPFGAMPLEPARDLLGGSWRRRRPARRRP